MHRNRLALTLMTCLAVPGFACAAAKKDSTKRELLDCATVQFDGSSLTPEENNFLFSIQKPLMTAETLGFAVGADTILSDYYAQRKGKEFNAEVLKIKELA